MAMTARVQDGDVTSELNITPLIDVMLVLLTLLLITLPIQTNAVKLDLPVSPATPIVKPPVVDLTVDFDGSVLWNGTPVDHAMLDAYLVRAAKQKLQPEIHVTASRLARYDTVAKILADAQRLGVTHIGIVGTERFVH